jgi:two-component system OmpR family sensor kinase
LDIDLIKKEKKTLFSFLALYSFLTIIIISSISFLYYNFQKDLMLQEKRVLLEDYSNDLITIIKYMHLNFETYKDYPRDGRFESAIYDSDKVQIFSTLQSKQIQFDKSIYLVENKIHFINQPESYYLGSKYIIIEVTDDKVWLEKIKQNILLYGSLAFVFMTFVGYFLLQLFLKPLKDTLRLLDRFIKDTTHELNTPVSTIVTNIEMIDKTILDEKLLKKINRIDIGAKTISNIYQDLTYLTLNNKIISQNETLNITQIIKQRVEYFKTLSNIKKIKVNTTLENDIKLYIDKIKFSKLVDNLLSNAIKYNTINGIIDIKLTQNSLAISNTGRGIKKEQIKKMFDRYSRFDNSVGGFGIGLNIVSMIAKEYNLAIDISSVENKETEVLIRW